MSLTDFANKACEHLPEGWQLEMFMEKGAGGWRLIGPDGDHINSDEVSPDLSFEQQGKAWVAIAQQGLTQEERS